MASARISIARLQCCSLKNDPSRSIVYRFNYTSLEAFSKFLFFCKVSCFSGWSQLQKLEKIVVKVNSLQIEQTLNHRHPTKVNKRILFRVTSTRSRVTVECRPKNVRHIQILSWIERHQVIGGEGTMKPYNNAHTEICSARGFLRKIDFLLDRKKTSWITSCVRDKRVVFVVAMARLARLLFSH